MRIVIVTDAWVPQVNGVVRTLQTLTSVLEEMGHKVLVISPDRYWTVPLPTYREIRIAPFPGKKMTREIKAFDPDAVHIATEGPLGLRARAWCVRWKFPFTSAFHTKFAEYINVRFNVPLSVGYGALKWFHAPSKALMVATKTVEDELLAQGFRTPIKRWTRGVDTDLFRPQDKTQLDGVIKGPRPWLLFVGRVAVEKNIEAFLETPVEGTKIVVGAGPQLEALKARYPDAHFAGEQTGEDLARYYACADAFVFPSKTDTFGLVLLEALAAGLPVAAYPVAGPLDVIGSAPVGALDVDLGRAIGRALSLDPKACREFALGRSWRSSVEQFLDNIHVAGADRKRSVA